MGDQKPALLEFAKECDRLSSILLAPYVLQSESVMSKSGDGGVASRMAERPEDLEPHEKRVDLYRKKVLNQIWVAMM